MTNPKITVVALSVDSTKAVFFKKDGGLFIVKQGDARLPDLVSQVKKALQHHQEITIEIPDLYPRRTEFEDAEKGTNGLVRFFRVARSYVKKVFNSDSPEKVSEDIEHISPLEIGIFPEMGAKPVQKEPVSNDAKLAQAKERMDKLMSVGIPTSDGAFHKPLENSTDTIVAVHTGTNTVVPEAQHLAHQLRAASKLQDYFGFTKFMERLSLVVDNRGHSVEDLMKFIEHADLPIADDGCIVIYKLLNKQSDGRYVDVYSKKVSQGIGSFVFMRAGLVDPNRRQDCSNGLHVAALSYLSTFSGDTLVIAKVRPEDVFAVPEYSHNKMRVSAYHILAEVPAQQKKAIIAGGSITATEAGSVLLNNILHGRHVGICDYVEITKHKGGGVIITKAQTSSPHNGEPVKSGKDSIHTTLDLSKSNEPIIPVAAPVTLNDLKSEDDSQDSTMRKSHKKAKVAKKSNVLEAQFGAIRYKTNNAASAAEFILRGKANAKKSWAALGFTADEVSLVMAALPKATNQKAEDQLAALAKIEERKNSGKVSANSPRGLIRNLLDKGSLSDAEYKAVLLLKRKAKKSWSALGVSPVEQAEIEKHTK